MALQSECNILMRYQKYAIETIRYFVNFIWKFLKWNDL